jgi:hypothetical protein
MKSGNKQEFRIVMVSFSVGAISSIVTTIIAFIAIKRAGMAWPGAIFGNEEFNWRDARIWLLAFAVYWAATISTVIIMRRRRSREEDER